MMKFLRFSIRKQLYCAISILCFSCLWAYSFVAAGQSELDPIDALQGTNLALLTTPTTESLRKYPPRTALSKKALRLRIGMTKEEVLKLLGTPTWVEETKGEQLIWIWYNGRCNPVEVMFNSERKVVGYDEGRADCLDKMYFAMLDDKYSCLHADRAHLCR